VQHGYGRLRNSSGTARCRNYPVSKDQDLSARHNKACFARFNGPR
jgi:hypothetical protein